MKKELKPKHFISKPVYPGGLKAMRQFLRKQKVYPKEALEKKIEGTVHLRYTINHLGAVVRTQIISGVGYGCDAEASRIVKLLKFKVGKTRKLRTQFHKTIRIHFKLPRAKKAKYRYITTTNKEKNKKSEKSYSYTITF